MTEPPTPPQTDLVSPTKLYPNHKVKTKRQPLTNRITIIKLILIVARVALITLAILIPLANIIKTRNSKQVTTNNITPVSPTTNPTTSWKTYVDNNNLYQISYPNDWVVEQYLDKEYQRTTINDHNTGIYVQIEPNFLIDNNKTIDQWITDGVKEYQDKCVVNNQGCGGGSPFELVKKTSINGYPAYKTSRNAIGVLSGLYIIYLVPHQQKTYAITLESEIENPPYDSNNFDEVGSKYASIYQQILSTFKFTQ